MTQKHTQGPWHITPPPHAPNQDRFVYAQDDYMVADCSRIPRRTDDEQRANAALIATAPDLLEALKMVSNFNWKNNRTHLLEIVNAAIDKAEGAK